MIGRKVSLSQDTVPVENMLLYFYLVLKINLLLKCVTSVWPKIRFMGSCGGTMVLLLCHSHWKRATDGRQALSNRISRSDPQ